MTDATDFLTKMTALADDAATAAAGDPVTSAATNSIAAAADNFVEARDGVHSIAFDADIGDNAFTLTFNGGVLTLRNLTTGEIEGAAIGTTDIAENEVRSVEFESLGAVVTLNSAFDHSAVISDVGGVFSAGGGRPGIQPGSIELIVATGSGAQGLTTNVVAIDATTASAAILTSGGFSGTASLNSTGVKQATLSDGVDSFTIEFLVTGAFSDTDDSSIEVDALGAMVFADAGFEQAPSAVSPSPETIQAAVLNGVDAASNRLQAEDGFDSIDFDNNVGVATFLVSYDANTGVLRLDNLTTGVVQGVDIDRTLAFSAGDTQSVDFDAVGATVVLNDAFDKAAPLGIDGGAVLSSGGSAEILPASIKLTSASGSGGEINGDVALAIDAVSADSATVSVGGFSGAGVDLSSTGVTSVTLTDGTDAFEIEFQVLSAFSSGDNVEVSLPQLGQLVFSETATFETFQGGSDSELFFGTSLDDVLNGGSGNDDITGLDGDDTLNGEDGDDVLRGRDGDDKLTGGRGVDEVSGGDGRDRLIGASGSDDLDGGAGDDRIFGNSGGDRIEGGGGDDILTGSFGADMFVVGTAGGTDRVTDFTVGEDRIDLSAYAFGDLADVLALVSDVGGSANIVLNGGLVTVVLDNVLKADLSAGDFLLTTAAADAFDAARLTAAEVAAQSAGASTVDAPASPAAPAAAGAPITIARLNSIASNADNRIAANDGVHSIAFDDDVGDNAFTLTFNGGVLTLRNLTTGEIEGAAIGTTDVAENEVRSVEFESLGAVVTLNSAFDHSIGISEIGGAFSGGGSSFVLPFSIEILSASDSGGQGLTSNIVAIDATDAGNAVLSIGSYSASGGDLSATGVKQATLTDGTDSFTIEFQVMTAFSDGDDGGLEIGALGAMVFADANVAPEAAPPALVQGFTRVDATISSFSGGDNRLESADGFQSFGFDPDVAAAAFLVSYDDDTGVLRLDNLTTGEVQGVAVGLATALSVGQTHSVEFGALGVTVVLDDAFDPGADIPIAGGAFNESGGPSVLASSIELLSASADAGDNLTGTTIVIDATSADNATLQAGDYTADGLDLSSSGVKSATLTDGTDSFEIQFQVTTAFSDGDDSGLELPQIGQLLFSDPVTPLVHRGGGAAETFAGDGADDTALAGHGDDTLSGGGGQDLLRGGGGDDTIDGDDGDDTLFGDDGDDAVDGGAGIDQVFGGAGDDVLDGGAGDDEIRGGDDADTLDGEAGNDALYGDNGDDTLDGGDDADLLKGGAGDDLLIGGAGDDVIVGHGGVDIAFGQGGDDEIRAGDGDDVIAGGTGADRLFGDAGDDSIAGGAGDDIIKGGAGADVFRFVVDADLDHILDFEDGVDRVNFVSHSGVDDIDDLTITAFRGGLDTKIALAADPTGPDMIILRGVAATDIDASDFQF